MKQAAQKVLTHYFLKKGYSSHCAYLLAKEFATDVFENRQNSLKQKAWAYRRGFLSSDIDNYGLTEKNYRDYLSNSEYYRHYPFNGKYDKWVDDKITIKYILYPFRDYMPKYYYHIRKKGEMIPLMDADDIDPQMPKTILELLAREKRLALKLTSSQSGIGFHKISFIDGDYQIDNKPSTEEEAIQFIENLDGYLVSEYIIAHPDIERIYGGSQNTARVMVINEDGRHPVIANSYMRFGSSRSGLIDNVPAGGMAAIIDVGNGRFHNALMIENHHILWRRVHPDTHVVVEGTVPHWDMISEKLIEISRFLSELTYMGFDIAPTEDGFKICEINSLQSLARFQNEYPLLVDNAASTFFNGRIKKHGIMR